MLTKLYIRNYAIIKELDLDFNSGLTTITGETGAGKSIILGALSLILGHRSDSSLFNEKGGKCIVEGTFNSEKYSIGELFKEFDLDFDVETTIRREITTSGKSRAFINDTPVNLKVLKAISSQLIDIHSQHQSMQIGKQEFQLDVLDIYSQATELRLKYEASYLSWRDKKRTLAALIEKRDRAALELDYYNYQYTQLDEANLQIGEQELLESEMERLNNSEDIKRALSETYSNLEGGDGSIIETLEEVTRGLSKIGEYLKEADELSTRLNSCAIELKDIASESYSLQVDIDHSPQRVLDIEARLDTIYSLQTRCRVKSIEELIEQKEEYLQKIDSASTIDSEVTKLENQLTKEEISLTKVADKLSKVRHSITSTIETKVEKFVSALGIPYATLKIDIEKTEGLTPTGIDKITFLFTGNRGKDPNDISKVASGGEISRVMLAIKYLLSTKTSLPTVIFDEIDTGVSGEVAGKMGDILHHLGEEMQVISITHLPQIASKGDSHLFVYKEHLEKETTTNIKYLTKSERIEEIAKMLSGDSITNSAIENAKELLIDTL